MKDTPLLPWNDMPYQEGGCLIADAGVVVVAASGIVTVPIALIPEKLG